LQHKEERIARSVHSAIKSKEGSMKKPMLICRSLPGQHTVAAPSTANEPGAVHGARNALRYIHALTTLAVSTFKVALTNRGAVWLGGGAEHTLPLHVAVFGRSCSIILYA
jgi:hypothetical protein